jgi:hypothetical protein
LYTQTSFKDNIYRFFKALNGLECYSSVHDTTVTYFFLLLAVSDMKDAHILIACRKLIDVHSLLLIHWLTRSSGTVYFGPFGGLYLLSVLSLYLVRGLAYAARGVG